MSPIGIKGEWGLYTRSTMIWLQMICWCWYWPSVRRFVVYKWDVLLYLWRCTFFKVIGFRVPTKAYPTIVFCTFFPFPFCIQDGPRIRVTIAPLGYSVWCGGLAHWICLFIDNRNKRRGLKHIDNFKRHLIPKPSVFSGGRFYGHSNDVSVQHEERLEGVAVDLGRWNL